MFKIAHNMQQMAKQFNFIYEIRKFLKNYLWLQRVNMKYDDES